MSTVEKNGNFSSMNLHFSSKSHLFSVFPISIQIPQDHGEIKAYYKLIFFQMLPDKSVKVLIKN